MRKSLLLITALAGCGFAVQGITVSMDSLVINNRIMGAPNYEVSFHSNASVAISLDSAFIVIDSMDTTGFARYARDDGLEVLLRESFISDFYSLWDLEKCDSTRFRMMQRESSTKGKQPFFFSVQDPERRIILMELCSCVYCTGVIWYPPFFRGTLVLHFSNGQTITLRLYSHESGTTSARHIPDKQQLPGFSAGRVVREVDFITIMYGPTNDLVRRIGIFDISGRVTATINLPDARHIGKTLRLNIAGFPAGWYCVRTISGASKETCGSFVIDR